MQIDGLAGGVPPTTADKGTAKPREARAALPATRTGADPRDLQRLERALAQHDIALRFSKDEATNNVVVQMVDEKTGEMIRQFPTEVSLSLAANFLRLQGVFLNEER